MAIFFPFVPAGTFFLPLSEQTAFAAISAFEFDFAVLCHGASRDHSLFPSREAILKFSNVRVAQRSQLH
ncbi:MAG TPA: hypothetical protein VMU78_05590 [Methylocella sp.]|nr:hypothetical protein [Methylocella sp.]